MTRSTSYFQSDALQPVFPWKRPRSEESDAADLAGPRLTLVQIGTGSIASWTAR